MYEVKTSQFSGPLDLLLGLIEKRKVSINDVSLADIADQYIDYLNRLEKFPLEEVAVFVVVASTLMLIKSRSLMPSMELTEEEERSIEELEDRLRLYRRIKELSARLSGLFGKNPMFARAGFKGVELGFMEPKGVTKETLRAALAGVLENLPAEETLPEVEVRKIITLEDKISELGERITRSLEISFSEFSVSRDDIGSENKKVEVIVSFLAMLELIKQGFIMVRQETVFESISISRREERPPSAIV